MITMDHEHIVASDKAIMGLVDLLRGAVAYLRKQGLTRKADWIENQAALYVDWIYTTQPQQQANFFARYADQIIDWGEIGQLVKEQVADNLMEITQKEEEQDAAEERRRRWMEIHLRE